MVKKNFLEQKLFLFNISIILRFLVWMILVRENIISTLFYQNGQYLSIKGHGQQKRTMFDQFEL